MSALSVAILMLSVAVAISVISHEVHLRRGQRDALRRMRARNDNRWR
jgi:hypothetical protein